MPATPRSLMWFGGQVHGVDAEVSFHSVRTASGTDEARARPTAVGAQSPFGTIGHSWSAMATSARRLMLGVTPSLPVSTA